MFSFREACHPMVETWPPKTETFEDQSHTVLSESKGKIELKVLDRGA